MKTLAINLDTSLKEVKNCPDMDLEVSPISKVIKISFPECDYQYVSKDGVVQLFQRVNIDEDTITKEARWIHYKINGLLHRGFLTNNWDYWGKEMKKYSEYELEEMIEEQEKEEYQLSLF